LEVRDLWPDYLVDMGVLRSGAMATRSLFWLERRLLNGSAAVVVVTESFRNRVVRKGVSRERVHVMPAGVDGDFYYPSDEPPPMSALVRRSDELVVGYLGNFGAGQALETVLLAAQHVGGRTEKVRFVLVGDGPRRDTLEAQASSLGLTNLSIHPPIAKELTPAFYANCDVCLVPLAPVPVFQETVPSKIFEILACERPVIASLDGEARAIVEASGGGWVTPPGDADALASAILRAAATAPDERRRIGVLGRAHVIHHYSREAISRAYLSVLEAVVSTRRSASTARGPARA
jgi:colanic acid biosynthesis glycosyl transferase WcaI